MFKKIIIFSLIAFLAFVSLLFLPHGPAKLIAVVVFLITFVSVIMLLSLYFIRDHEKPKRKKILFFTGLILMGIGYILSKGNQEPNLIASPIMAVGSIFFMALIVHSISPYIFPSKNKTLAP